MRLKMKVFALVLAFVASIMLMGTGNLFAAPDTKSTAKTTAKPAAKPAASKQPQDICNKAKDLILKGKEKEAADLLTKATKENPTKSEAWIILGTLYLNKGKTDLSIATYKKAVEQIKKSPELWFNYGFAQGKANKYADALQSFDKALAFKPDYSDALKYKGYALMKLYRYNEAIVAFDKASRVDPTDLYSKLFLGITTFEVGNKDEGKKIIGEVLKKNPNLKSEMPDDLKKTLGI
jgi:tetratricopeptide (TPR) repeat protein